MRCPVNFVYLFEHEIRASSENLVRTMPWGDAFWGIHIKFPAHLYTKTAGLDWDRVTTENPPQSPMAALAWILE